MPSHYEYDASSAEPYRNVEGAVIDPPARLTPQFLLVNKLPVYVKTTMPPQSNITLTIKQGGGLPGQPLRIERSKYPFCVTEQVAHETLRSGGRDLWGAIDKGMLVLVWPADAEAMLESRKRSGDGDRQRLSKWSALNAQKSPEVAENERIMRQAKMEQENADVEAAAEQQDPVNGRVMDLVSRVAAGEVKLERALDEFETLAEVMEERDFNYAIANLKGGKLREWLQAQLAQMMSTQKKSKKKNKQKSVEQLSAKQPVKKVATDEGGVFDDSEPEMTEEEAEAEALAEAAARQRQRVNG